MSPDPHTVTCYHCGSLYDAAETDFCGCVGAERTLVCPFCFKCFCQATLEERQRFWAAAPHDLRMRRQALLQKTVAPPDNPPADKVTRPLVLVAEDEPLALQAAMAMVRGLGYGAVAARDGAEALDLAREYHPDLVLSDALMPRIDGREVCRRIKVDAGGRKVRTIVMTSKFTAMKYRLEAQKTFQVDDYLIKPLDLQLLRDLLQKHLG